MNRFQSLLAAAVAALILPAVPLPALANDGVTVQAPYARVLTPMSKSGAAFMVIMNHEGADDRLISASSDVADRVELHTHKTDSNGTMQMLKVPEGFVIPAGGKHALARGGDHLMFLGLKEPLQQGDVIRLMLTFERAGEVALEVPVDNTRSETMGRKGMVTHDKGTMQPGQMQHSH